MGLGGIPVTGGWRSAGGERKASAFAGVLPPAPLPPCGFLKSVAGGKPESARLPATTLPRAPCVWPTVAGGGLTLVA